MAGRRREAWAPEWRASRGLQLPPAPRAVPAPAPRAPLGQGWGGGQVGDPPLPGPGAGAGGLGQTPPSAERVRERVLRRRPVMARPAGGRGERGPRTSSARICAGPGDAGGWPGDRADGKRGPLLAPLTRLRCMGKGLFLLKELDMVEALTFPRPVENWWCVFIWVRVRVSLHLEG